MGTDTRGRLRLVALVGLLVVGLGATVAAGFVIADDQRSGEEVLLDVQEKYNTAESISADTVVTVESEAGTVTADVGIAAADEQLRINVSDDDGYFLAGTDGEATWVFDPATELTGVVQETADGSAMISLRAGTDEPMGGLSALLPLEVGSETTVGELRDQFGGELPAAFDDIDDTTTLEELPDELDGNVSDILPDSFDSEEFNASGFNISDFDLESFEFDELDEFDAEALPSTFNETAVEEFVEKLESTAEDGVSDDAFEDVTLNETAVDEARAAINDALPAEIDDLESYESLDALTDDLEIVANKTTVERVGTTTIDGVEANELLITHPDLPGETRLYTSIEEDTILRQVTETPNGTVTIDVPETRFDVDPAASTFEPRGTTELGNATLNVDTVETTDALADATPFDVAVPGESWTLTNATVTTATVSFELPNSLPSTITTTAATYTDDDRTLVVSQSPVVEGDGITINETTLTELATADIDSELEAEFDVETTTETIDDREVVITSTDDGTATTASWVSDETVVTVTTDGDQDAVESLIANVEFGVDQ